MQNSAGYSKRSLVDKLGIKTGFRIVFVNRPAELEKILSPLPSDTTISLRLDGMYDVIHYFSTEKKELVMFFSILKKHLKPNGMLWISWLRPHGGQAKALRPAKPDQGKHTDLNENIIREIGLSNGLVDVKIIAVDDTWSGLKFVFRLKDRA